MATLSYLEPLSAVLFSALFLHERMLPLQFLGAMLIIGGAMLGEIPSNRRKCDGKMKDSVM